MYLLEYLLTYLLTYLLNCPATTAHCLSAVLPVALGKSNDDDDEHATKTNNVPTACE